MIDHIEADINDMLESMKNRPNAAKYAPRRYAEVILDMLEGFGMYVPYPEGPYNPEDLEHLNGWEPEDDITT